MPHGKTQLESTVGKVSSLFLFNAIFGGKTGRARVETAQQI